MTLNIAHAWLYVIRCLFLYKSILIKYKFKQITTHLINKRETRLSLYEQTLEPTNPKNSSGSSFKLIDIDTDTSYRPETFDRTDRAVSCVPWLWKYGSCISIQDPRMIRRNCLHLVKPDSPNFGMRLNDRQLRSVCDMLGYYGIKPHRVPEQEGTSREGLIINLLEASREINQNLLEALRDLTQQVLQVLRLVEARSQEDNRIAPLPSPSSFLKNDINHK